MDPKRRPFDTGRSACYTARTQGKAGEDSRFPVVLFRFLLLASCLSSGIASVMGFHDCLKGNPDNDSKLHGLVSRFSFLLRV